MRLNVFMRVHIARLRLLAESAPDTGTHTHTYDEAPTRTHSLHTQILGPVLPGGLWLKSIVQISREPVNQSCIASPTATATIVRQNQQQQHTIYS